MKKHTEKPAGPEEKGGPKGRKPKTERAKVSVTGENLEISLKPGVVKKTRIEKTRKETEKKAKEAVKDRKDAPDASGKKAKHPDAAMPQAIAEPDAPAAPQTVEEAVPPPATSPQQPSAEEILDESTEAEFDRMTGQSVLYNGPTKSNLRIFRKILNQDTSKYTESDLEISREILYGAVARYYKLTRLTREVAIVLASFTNVIAHRGNELPMDEVRTFAEKAILDFKGLTSISVDEARILSNNFKGSGLYFNGLKSIDKDAAEALANYEGAISFEGLTSISVDEARTFAGYKAKELVFRNWGPVSIDEDAAEALSDYKGYFRVSNEIRDVIERARRRKEVREKISKAEAPAATPQEPSAEGTKEQPQVPSLPELLAAIKTADTNKAGEALEQIKQGFLQAGFKPEIVNNLIVSDESKSRVGYKDSKGEIYPVNFSRDVYDNFIITIHFEKNEIVPDYRLYIYSDYTLEHFEKKIKDIKLEYEAVLKLKEKLGDRVKIHSLQTVDYFYKYKPWYIYWFTDCKTFYLASPSLKKRTSEFSLETITAEEIDAELAKLGADTTPQEGPELGSTASDDAANFKEKLLAMKFDEDFVTWLEFDETSQTKLSYTSKATGKKFEVIYIIEDKPPFSLTISRNGKDMLIESNTTPEDIDKYYKTRWEKIKGLFSRKKEVSPRGPETAATQPEGTAETGPTAPSQEATAALTTEAGIAETHAEEAFFDKGGEGGSVRPDLSRPAVVSAQEEPPPPAAPAPAAPQQQHFGPPPQEQPLSTKADVGRQDFGKPVDREEEERLDLSYTPIGRITNWVRNHVGLIVGACVIAAGVTALYISRDHWQMPWGGKQYECGLKRVENWPPKLSAVCTNPKGKIEGQIVMLRTPETADCEWQDANGDGVRDTIISCRAQLGLQTAAGEEAAKTRIRNFKVPQEVNKAELAEVRFK